MYICKCVYWYANNLTNIYLYECINECSIFIRHIRITATLNFTKALTRTFIYKYTVSQTIIFKVKKKTKSKFLSQQLNSGDFLRAIGKFKKKTHKIQKNA